jgi:hypothetical protein
VALAKAVPYSGSEVWRIRSIRSARQVGQTIRRSPFGTLGLIETIGPPQIPQPATISACRSDRVISHLLSVLGIGGLGGGSKHSAYNFERPDIDSQMRPALEPSQRHPKGHLVRQPVEREIR